MLREPRRRCELGQPGIELAAKALRFAWVSGGGPPPTTPLERIVSMKSRMPKHPRMVSGE